VGPPAGDEFTIMFMPDTQRYAAQEEGAQANQMQSVMDWIAQNRERWNIQLVLHPGDVVEHGREHGEWSFAEAWFETLESAEIPYAVAVGNHDYQGHFEDREALNFNRVLSPERFQASPWWEDGGFFEAGKSDNLYFTTEMGGSKYLVLTMEFQPRSPVVEWADGILRAYPDHRAILMTHDFMNELGRFDSTTYDLEDATSGQELYNRLMSRHENIFLVVSGHHSRGTSRRYDPDTGAHYLYFDPKLLDWGKEGWIRAMVFSPSRGTLRVVTYSPSMDQYRTDYQNLFTLDTPYITEETVGSDEEEEVVIPEDFALLQNYPNPFNPTTRIDYGLPEAQAVRLVVYDVLGRQVEVLVDGFQQAGLHSVAWSADHLPSGMYLYSLQTGSTTLHRSMVLAK
jgi:3',5'-cyclic AMP phosphodiesterase CpdA